MFFEVQLVKVLFVKLVLQKFKQHLRKQGSKSSQTYGRQSPLHGDHTAVPASRLPQSIPISIPLAPRPSEGPQKRSLEGLNSEIQKLVLTDSQTERVSLHCFENQTLVQRVTSFIQWESRYPADKMYCLEYIII